MANMIGTEPNQVPTNADLGSSAYIDREELVKELLEKIAELEARITALEAK